jgi:hypothetical protein
MLLFCPGAKISCHVDHQNSTTCKLSSEQSHMVMVGKLGELPRFLVLNSGTESFGNSSVSAFSSLLFALVQNYSLAF